MSNTISNEVITSFQNKLQNHPIYESITQIEDLQCFMEHHIYSVWDFMSLIKYLQNQVAPAQQPWVPATDTSVRRFINELVLEEESDQGMPADEDNFISHFELYCGAMKEIGADNTVVLAYVNTVKIRGIEAALNESEIPEPSRQFNRTTFNIINSGKPHTVAAALALGREHVIPCMFRSFLDKMQITESQAPLFHYYLKRHIHLDEDFHAPLSLRLLNQLCANDEIKQQEAIEAANLAIDARIKFWDGVYAAIKNK